MILYFRDFLALPANLKYYVIERHTVFLYVVDSAVTTITYRPSKRKQ